MNGAFPVMSFRHAEKSSTETDRPDAYQFEFTNSLGEKYKGCVAYSVHEQELKFVDHNEGSSNVYFIFVMVNNSFLYAMFVILADFATKMLSNN